MKFPTGTIIVFAIGAAVGGGAFLAYDWMQVDVPRFADWKPEKASGSEVEEPDSDRLLARIGEQEAEIDRLKALLEESAEGEPLSDAAAEESEPAPSRIDLMRARMDERTNNRIDSLVEAYGLSEAQRQLVAQIYEQRRQNFIARHSGQEVAPINMDAALESIMTDDQFARYMEETQQEIYNRAEVMATTHLVRMSQQLNLPQEQQDLIYDTINTVAQEAMIARQTGEIYNLQAVINDRLSTILTPEQLQTLQQGNTDRPGGGGPGGFGPGPGP